MRNSIVLGMALFTLVVPAVSSAQSTSGTPAGGHVFLSVNVVGQAGDGEVLNQEVTSTVYGETATFTAAQPVSLAAGVFDFGGGFRSSQFGVGVSFTTSKNTDSAVATAVVPHPFLFNRPRTANSTVDDLEHTERVVHLQAYYFLPLENNVEIAFFLGPSFYKVKQDYVTGLGSFSESSDFQTVSVSLGHATAEDSQVGYNIGAEATYSFTPNVGIGALLRFTRATVDLDLGGQSTSMNVGDLQFGGGLRLRF